MRNQHLSQRSRSLLPWLRQS
jgi:hypothetical protein